MVLPSCGRLRWSATTSSSIKASASAEKKVRAFRYLLGFQRSKFRKSQSGEPRNSMDQLKETADAVVHRAEHRGATAADVFIQQDDTFSVSVRMGEVETLKEAISRALRLRIFVGKRTATSQTSDFSPAVVD